MPESQYSISSIISVGQMNPSFVTWNNGTALNSTAALVSNDISYNTLNVSLSQTTTITGGVVTFQGSFDGVTFFNMTGFIPGTSTIVGPTYTLQANTYATFQFNLTAIPYFQVLLSTAITGTGAVTIGFAADSFVGSNIFVSGTVASTQSGTWNVGVTGTVAVTQSTSPWVVSLASTTITGNVSVVGTLTHNNAAPVANNIGALVGVASSAAPTYTAGDQVLVSTDLAGNTRVVLNAETTKVIGTVNQGTSPWVVSLASTTVTGTVAVTQSTSPWVVAGNLTHNNAAPAANNVGALVAVASSAAPTYTAGDQVLLSTDLAGNLRTTTAIAANASVNVNQWAGTQLGAPTNFGTTPGAVVAGSVNSSLFAGTTGLTATGTSLNTNITNTVTAAGNLTNNNAAPAATNLGVLPAIAETAYGTVTYTTGNQVLPVTDLHGALNQDLQAYAGTQLTGTVTAYGTAPTGNVFGVNAFITNTPTVNQGTSPWVVSGTVTANQGTSPWVVSLTSTTITGTVAVTQSTSPWVVAGNKTNNNAAPGATNEGVLPALANAASPAWTEGNQVLESVDLTGRQRMRGTLTNNNAAPAADQLSVLPALANAAAPTWTEGDQVLESVDLKGNQRTALLNWGGTTLGAPANYGTSPGAVIAGSVNAFITNTVPVTLTSTTITGTVAVTQSTSPWIVAGNLTNNNAAPAANNLGVLPAIAATSYTTQTYTNGDQVLLVTDLHGAINDDLQAVAGVQLGATAVTNFGTAPAAAAVPGVNASIFAGTTALTATGSSLNANITNTVTVAGNKTNNNAAPGATNEGVLPAVANAASPAWTEGNQVAESVDLTGRQRVRGTLTNNNAAPAADQISVMPALANAAAPTWTEGDQVLESVDLKGNQRTLPSGVYNITEPAPANTTTSPFQQDQAADLLTFPGIQFRVGATWNSGTALNTLQFPTGTATQGQLMGGGAFIVQLDQTTTITGGAVTFQGTYDNINWVTIPTAQVLNPNTFVALTNPYTFVASTNQPFLIVDNGYVAVRANLTSAITGTGTVIPYWATLAATPVTPISGTVTISNLPSTATRTYVTFFFDNVAGVTTEALLSGQTNKGNTVTAAQTSYTVTAGKTLRIQSISANVVNTTSLAQQFKLRLRQASAGFSASSNIVWGTIIGSQPGSNAVNNAANFDFPDGLEIAAGQIIGFSHINLISTNGAITVQMTGYEY